ncbi:uncharacterized protein LOC131222306 [Magnolia sinica]|uniref:uncharacterized protein LOC131222306 n=1 Tax=Magnolia sinica TaxID=86752 RepID=UPI00265A387E|nr:uncharacterized protein LOC131222306 [Magnolia sinica]XP_058073314.1 uncharacterized protein LOC131222306 [Magnolia sinica]
METPKELKDSTANMLRASCYSPSLSSSSSSWHRRSQSAPDDGLPEDLLNMSPRSSQYSNSIVHLERSLHEQCSLRRVLEKALGCNSPTYVASNGTPIPKPAAELIKEIAVLELEVMHLEQYLLSLYRTAFDHHLTVKPSALMCQGSAPLMQDSGPPILEQTNCTVHSNPLCVYNDSCSEGMSQSYSLEGVEEQQDCKDRHAQIFYPHSSTNSDDTTYPPRQNSKRGSQNAGLRPRSLADHLGASLADLLPLTPDRLSEEIVRCMSAIYCKLVDPPLTQIGGLSASPTSSLSSSSIFSPQDDNCSSQCNNDEITVDTFDLEGLKEKHGPYWGMVEVSKISLDDDRFNYAAKMLQNFRSLIQRLEKVDPRKMKHEERLAFWINVHNALVMHANLAYGIPHSMKTASLNQKAGYNIGGHSINAYVIQSSILRCRSHHPAPWLRMVFSPGKKFRTGNGKHMYELDHPEPLVHFALCSGAYSDPMVRVYTAKRIFPELKLAREEFIQISVSIPKKKKIILPRVLYYFAKDASLDLCDLLEMVRDCLPEAQKKDIRRCLRGRVGKCVEWAPHNLAFRYIMHGELVKDITSI